MSEVQAVNAARSELVEHRRAVLINAVASGKLDWAVVRAHKLLDVDNRKGET